LKLLLVLKKIVAKQMAKWDYRGCQAVKRHHTKRVNVSTNSSTFTASLCL